MSLPSPAEPTKAQGTRQEEKGTAHHRATHAQAQDEERTGKVLGNQVTEQKVKDLTMNTTHQMSTFSETGSFRITSGAIHATVPAKDILVLLSLSSLDVPKSEIFTASVCVTKTLEKGEKKKEISIL